MRLDREIDLHGYTRAEARAHLEAIWARREWHGLRRVRIIHGTGAVLHRVVRQWCEEKGIPWTTEAQNPGVTILHPGLRPKTPPVPPHHPMAHLKRRLPPPVPKEPEQENENRKS